MIKRLSLLLLIIINFSSCALINYQDLPEIVSTAVFGVEDINVDQELINQKKYSFAKVSLGRTGVALLTLSTIEGDNFRWVSESGEVIITKNGKVVKTEGLPHNIDLIESKKIESNKQEAFIFLSNPDAFITQRLTIITTDDSTKELFKTIRFKWKGENVYKYNANGLPIFTRQDIHPKLPIIEINFYY